MFGNIGTFTAHGSRFNNASASQFNSNAATSGVFGPGDPQWRGSLQESNSMPVTRRAISAPAPMFGHINHLQAGDSTFNQAGSDQYNYNLASDHTVSAPATARLTTGLAVPVVSVTQPASAPPEVPALAQQSELTPIAAEARMFGSIGRFDTFNSDFNNSLGTQVNVSHGRVSSPHSFTSFGNTDQPRPPLPPVPGLSPPSPRPPLVPVNPPSSNLGPNPFLEPEQGPPEPSSSKPDSKKLKKKLFGRKKPEGFGEKTALALGVTDYVLTTLQNASRFSHVPFLPEAATAALSILHGIQGAKDNQGAFHRLAVHGCNLISSVALVYEERRREGRELAPELMTILQELVEKLGPVKKFVEEMHARHGFTGNIKKVILYRHEAAQVEEYREKLTQALAEFGLRSNISVHDGVAQIDKRLEELVEAMNIIGLQAPPRRGTFFPSSPPVSRPSSTHSAMMQAEPVPITEEPVPVASGLAFASAEVIGTAASSPASAPAAAPNVFSTPGFPFAASLTPSPGSQPEPVPIPSGLASASAEAIGTAAFSPASPPAAAPNVFSTPGFPFITSFTPSPGSQPVWVNASGSMFNQVGGNQTVTTAVHNIAVSGGEYIEHAAGAASAAA